MPLTGFIDSFDQFGIHGWLHHARHQNLVPFVEIVVNRRLAATVRSGLFRQDLLEAGYGEGMRSFWFNPFESLLPGPNTVEVFAAGTDQLLPGGQQILYPDLTRDRSNFADSEERAKSRWKQDEEDLSLTWGNVMTGDSFFDQVDRYFPFHADVKIYEIGPGYGRLLKTILQRQYAYKEYFGLDLSQARVTRLTSAFGNSRTRFQAGACDVTVPPERFNLVISSATFEHLFPSMAATLERIYAAMLPGGMAFLDFICHDPELAISRAYFEEFGGKAYIRIYSQEEIRAFFLNAGFEMVDLVYPMVTGLDVGQNEIKRALAIVRKPQGAV